MTLQDAEGRLPLHWTAGNASAATVKRIMAVAPVTINARDNEQRTALHLAVAEGSKAVVEALVGGQRGRGVRKAVRFCI